MKNKLIFDLGYGNKYLELPLRILQPFIMILTGVIDILLLPTPYVCSFNNKLLVRLVRKQMKIRRKRLENGNK